MDDRKPPESNVARLHRDGEPDEEERRRLARTIFASEDDVGTLSRGNLLLPRPNPPPHEEPPAEPDPFFEQLQGPDHPTTPRGALGDRTDTVEYFEKLGSQTAAEMSAEATAAQPTAVSMPGSARLPAEINKPRPRATRRDRAATSRGATAEPTVSRRRPRLAMAPVAAATGVLVVAAAALAAIVAGNGHTDATHRTVVTRQSNPGPAAGAFLASITAANKERGRAAQRRTSAQRSSRTQRHRHFTGRRHVAHAAKSTTTPPPSSSSVASTVPASGTQPVRSNPAPQEASAASSGPSGSSGSASAASSHQPVWGANGILGPGHSPNG